MSTARSLSTVCESHPELFFQRLEGRHEGCQIVGLSRLFRVDEGLFETLFEEAAGVLATTTDGSVCDPPEALRANVAQVAEAERQGRSAICPVRLPALVDAQGTVQGLLVLSPLLTSASEAVAMIDNICVRPGSWGRGVAKVLTQAHAECVRWSLSLDAHHPVVAVSEYAWLEPGAPLDHTARALQYFERLWGLQAALCADGSGRVEALPYQAPEPSGEAPTRCCLMINGTPELSQLGRIVDALLDTYLHMGTDTYDRHQVERIRDELRRSLTDAQAVRYTSWAAASTLQHGAPSSALTPVPA